MKKLVSMLLSLLLVLSLSVPAFAATNLPSSTVDFAAPSIEDPNAEQTVWYFRNNNGIIEKRLWSLTYGIWLTDWIPIGTVIDP